MESHLDNLVLERLSTVASAMNRRLDRTGWSAVDRAASSDEAFDDGWVRAALVRAVLAASMSEAGGQAVKRYSNGGRELRVTDHYVEQRFRMKTARRDKKGRLRVVASSESVLAKPAPTSIQGSLLPSIVPEVTEQWILAVVLHHEARLIAEVVAAQATGFERGTPGKLTLAKVTPVPFEAVKSKRRFESLEEELEDHELLEEEELGLDEGEEGEGGGLLGT